MFCKIIENMYLLYGNTEDICFEYIPSLGKDKSPFFEL